MLTYASHQDVAAVAEARKRLLFVSLHQAGVASDICRQDRGKSAC
jgi:hypothetical protein